MGNLIESNQINCASATDEYIRCVHCGKSTNMLTSIIASYKGCKQFNCVSCGKVGTYRIGPFKGIVFNYVKPEPIEMSNWADHVKEEDFL